MKYDAVIFDLWGTLVDGLQESTYQDSLHRTAQAAGAPPADFIRIWRSDEVYFGRDTGRFATQADCIRHVCGMLGLTPDNEAIQRAADVRAEFTRTGMVPRPGTAEVLESLRARGLKLGLMTACSRNSVRFWPQTSLAGLFDAALFSCDVGLTKPDPRFYELACRRLDVSPDRCLYVGDGAGNELTGATEAGMTAVLICAPHEQDIVMARPEARNWSGVRITSLSEVPALVD